MLKVKVDKLCIEYIYIYIYIKKKKKHKFVMKLKKKSKIHELLIFFFTMIHYSQFSIVQLVNYERKKNY